MDPITHFFEHFESLEDPRDQDHANFRHKFTDILVIVSLAVICGADNWSEIYCFAESRQSWFERYLELPHGIPSADTIRRLFMRLDAKHFERCFIHWAKDLNALLSKNQTHRHIAIDGKTSRRSGSKKKGKHPLHLVSAWASDTRLVLGQLATEDKSNEIEVIPELLRLIDVEKAIVTMDAMGCQKAIAEQLLQQKAHYVLTLKDNHPTLARAVQAVYQKGEETQFKKMHHRRKTEKIRNHGRIETRKYTIISCKDKQEFQALWPGLHSLGKVEVKRTINQKTTLMTRYFLTSLDYPNIDLFMQAVRKHWDIEINLHWSLDVSFNDDLNRTRTDYAAENLSIIKRIALNLLKQEKSIKVGITAKRKKAGWDTHYLKKIISLFT